MQNGKVWLREEVSLDEMLEDPIVRLLMERDGLDKEAVQSAFLAASERIASEPERHVDTVS